MSKKIISILLAVVLIVFDIPLTVLNVNAETEYTSGNYTYTVSDGKATITASTVDGAISIPRYLDGYIVTSIGDSAFAGRRLLTSVTIPDSVTSIGKSAFSCCDSLTSITIPGSVISIDSYAFSSCRKLSNITILSGVTSIGYCAFSECVGLTSITIPGSVTSIGSAAFRYCHGLTSITIQDGVASIGDDAFAMCDRLTSIAIPNSVTSIGSSTFRYCSELTSITISSSVTSLGDQMLSFCNKLTSIIVEPGNSIFHSAGNCLIETESKALIYGCKSSIIPNDGSVTSIGSYAFYGCHGLTNITIPNSVTSIGYKAFSSCSGLTSITIQDGVTSIGSSAFSACNSLTSITIPGSVISIGSYAFEFCKGLAIITILSGVTSIGKYAFEGCTGLQSIIIPSSVTSIGERAFYECSQFTIYGQKNSYAQTYANRYNLPFSSSIDTDEFYQYIYRFLANNYPVYLNNVAYNNYTSTCLSICNDAVQEYNDTDNFLLSYAESFVNGTSIIVQDLFAKMGVGQSLEDEWLEKNALEYIKRLQDSENIISETWKDVEKKYKDFKFIVKAIDTADSATIEIQKAKFIKEVSTRTSCLSKEETDKIADHLLKKQPNNISNFFSKADYVVDLADILLYSCQMLDVEVSSLELLKNNISSNTPLYHAIEEQIMAIKENPSRYVCEKYLTDEVTGKIVSFLDDFADWSAGMLTGTDVSVTAKVVRTVSELLYNYIYKGAKIDEIYGAIVAYDFYATTTSSWITLLNQQIINQANGCPNSEELLTNFKFMYEAKRVALENYVDACIKIEKKGDYTSLLNNIKENVSDNGLLCFERYISSCMNTLRTDISKGTVSCNHGITHIIKTILPTCTTIGYRENVCDICGYTYQTDVAAALGHSYAANVIEPTCANEGYTEYSCTRCRTSYIGNTVSELGHDYEITKVNASCTENGYTLYVCKVCGHSYKSNMVTAQGHSFSNWIVDHYATPDENGERHHICLVCGNIEVEEIPPLKGLSFRGASLTLHDNLTFNFKVSKELFEEESYTNPCVKFVLNDRETVVRDYNIVDDKYVFDFTDIAPNQMNDTIYATLYAEYDGVVYASETKEYSVAQYCYNMLNKYSGDEYSKLRTLLVDLLNYGAQSQIYTDYNTNALVTEQLTEEQTSWGTVETPELQSVMDQNFKVIDNPKAVWKGAGLNLQDSVTMRFKIATESIDGLSIKVTSESGEWTISSDYFEETDGGYYVYFDGLNAGQMSTAVYLTVYEGKTAVSNTICYSIESYAYSKQNSTDEKLNNLLVAMMRYGNSAYSYVIK